MAQQPDQQSELQSELQPELQPDERLARTRRVQSLAYACTEAVAATMREGDSERQVAARMAAWLAERGLREWFHRPFAWFGERTAFQARGGWTPLHFFPTGRRLTAGTPVILDVAPVLGGAVADVGYACWFGDGGDPLHDRMLADLEPYRSLVLDGVLAERPLSAIYADVDRLITDQGYRSCHRTYPFGVIAHRVADVAPAVPGPLRSVRTGGFGLGAQRFLLEALRDARARRGDSPLWNGSRHSRHRATPGLWAVEPHLGFRGMGVKWEEILVVTDDTAYWLDDDLPHVRRWATDRTGVAA